MKEVSKFFGQLLEKYGVDAKTGNWSGRQTQYLRFKVLTKIADFKGSAVLDVGCGLADLYQYLKENKIEFKGYYGWDICHELIEVAKKRFPELKKALQKRDILKIKVKKGGKQYDWVICSGTLNNYSYRYQWQVIAKMFAICQKGVAFNILSSYADFFETNYGYASPAETFTFCKTLTPWVDLVHSYLPHDFTIFMYKKPRGSK